MIATLLENIQKEWETLKKVPITFVTFGALFSLVGFSIGSWYYAERFNVLNGEIARYRVALGIDKRGSNALSELTNAELQAKAQGIAINVRNLCFSFQKRSNQIRPATGIDKKVMKEHFEREHALEQQVSEEFDQDLKSDFLNTNNELYRRLDPKAIAAVIRGPIFRDRETGTPIGMASLMTLAPEGEAAYLCTVADQMEQMAKLLQTKSGQ